MEIFMGVVNTAGLKSHVRLRLVNRLRTSSKRRKHSFESLPLIDYHDKNINVSPRPNGDV